MLLGCLWHLLLPFSMTISVELIGSTKTIGKENNCLLKGQRVSERVASQSERRMRDPNWQTSNNANNCRNPHLFCIKGSQKESTKSK